MFVVYKLRMKDLTFYADFEHKERVKEFQTLEEGEKCMKEMNEKDDECVYTIMME